MIHPIILSGGSGARLWPLMQAGLPKQFLALASLRPLLQETAMRFAGRPGFAPPTVICHEDHRFVVAEQLRHLDGAPPRIVLEPERRNTAPAAALAALLAAETDPGSVLLVLPADHHIGNVAALHAAVATAAAAARAGRLVTFGVKPDRPHTGYGYIRVGASLSDAAGCHAIDRFVEKPDRAAAEALLAAGDHLWNAGMFMMRADRFLDELRRWEPAVFDACRAAVAHSAADADFLRPDGAAFAACPSISIDKAVMERTAAGAVVPVDMGWRDIGSWAALWEVLERDGEGNAVHGPVTALDTSGSLLRSDGPELAVIGLKDHAVVATRDAVLVCPLDRAEEVRAIAERSAPAATTDASAGAAPDGGPASPARAIPSANGG